MIASREVCQMFAHFLRCTWRQFFADDAIEFFFARDRMAGVPEITNVARRIHIVEIGKHRVPMFLCLLDVIDLAENEILEQIRRLKLFAARIQRLENDKSFFEARRFHIHDFELLEERLLIVLQQAIAILACRARFQTFFDMLREILIRIAHILPRMLPFLFL